MTRFFIISLIISCTFFSWKAPVSSSLTEPNRPIPRGEFLFPLSPGTTTSLSGSYGDLRINHFHAGLDIRTGGVEGQSVLSVGDGYVSRIGVSPGGYGNALYITHPNGYTSVYGHLKEFADKIKRELVKRQYAQQSWEINVNFSPGELPVRRGELVAYSGNTGGSGGPHLHFELRNEAEETLNPALFGFKEVVDSQKPVIQKVTLKTMDEYSRINGQFGEVTLTPVALKNGNYVLNNSITATGNIGVEVLAYDKSQTSPFRLGVTTINMTANDSPVYRFHLEHMPFDTKLDMNLHTDYDRMVNGGEKYHKLYVEEGNRLNLYETNGNRGLINVTDNQTRVEVALQDTYENTTFLNFNLIKEELQNFETSYLDNYQPKILVTQFGNILRIQAVGSPTANNSAILQWKGTPKNINPSYKTANSTVYLYNLNDGLVDFVQIGNSTESIRLNAGVSPGRRKVQAPNFQIDFEDALYQPIYLYLTNLGNKLVLDEDRFPLKGRFTVNWTTYLSAGDEKMGVYLDGTKPKYVGGEWNGNQVTFRPKELGSYSIQRDDEPPTITPRRVNSSELSFYIKDNLSGIKNISCFVNGEWVMMEYEPKLNLIWSEKLRPEVPFSGQIRLEITDNANNKNVYEKVL